MINKLMFIIVVMVGVLSMPLEAGDIASVVESDGAVEDKYLLRATTCYCMIPENVTEKFEAVGGKIIITETSLTERFKLNVEAAGVYRYVEHSNGDTIYEIWIKTRSEEDYALIHEMGHFIDRESDMVSDSKEFQAIHSEEVEKFASKFHTSQGNYSTTKEYFAESYQFCVAYPKEMQRVCPETYAFVMNVVENF